MFALLISLFRIKYMEIDLLLCCVNRHRPYKSHIVFSYHLLLKAALTVWRKNSALVPQPRTAEIAHDEPPQI